MAREFQKNGDPYGWKPYDLFDSIYDKKDYLLKIRISGKEWHSPLYDPKVEVEVNKKLYNKKNKFIRHMLLDKFFVTISKKPKLTSKRNVKLSDRSLNDIFKWISINRDSLLEYWNDAEKVILSDFSFKWIPEKIKNLKLNNNINIRVLKDTYPYRRRISVDIYSDNRYGYGPHVKVNVKEISFLVSIAINPLVIKKENIDQFTIEEYIENYNNYLKSNIDRKDLLMIREWIYFHRELLLMYWKSEITDSKLVKYILNNFLYDNIDMKGIMRYGDSDYESTYDKIIKKLKSRPIYYENRFFSNKYNTIEELFGIKLKYGNLTWDEE